MDLFYGYMDENKDPGVNALIHTTTKKLAVNMHKRKGFKLYEQTKIDVSSR